MIRFHLRQLEPRIAINSPRKLLNVWSSRDREVIRDTVESLHHGQPCCTFPISSRWGTM